ncbi:hypothetical protein JQ607_03440 [Bradyrhizobium liaoningense]|uniref:hypothetical protein n=1 Tax=Bradyrhizobium liaoningense TaxID=43992 RepID=UPI001BA625D7|nr:hypothetical protein [Bradyrhizobium liaoningense]MBR0839239.1 hypothetical protein [Bradyrhizobium liaoningense]
MIHLSIRTHAIRAPPRDNTKAANITVYTVQVNTGGDPTSSVLQNRAGSIDKLNLVTSIDPEAGRGALRQICRDR